MEWSGSLPVTSRRALVALGVVAVLCATSGLKAQPPAQTPPAAQAPAQPADPLKFNIDSPVLIVFTVKAEKAADFEAAWAGIRAGFAKTTKPDLKAFGDTLKVYKVDFTAIAMPAPPAGSPVVYVQQIDSPSKTFSYNPVKIIYEMLNNNGQEGGAITRPEADDLYGKLGLKEQLVTINPWPLSKLGG